MSLVCVPTTAGTGSEVSGGAIVTDPETDEKMGIASPNLRAAHALVDPELTWSLPADVTAHSGIDALAQAIAAVVAKACTPIGDAIGLEATRLAGPVARARCGRFGPRRTLGDGMREPSRRLGDEHLQCGGRAFPRAGAWRRVPLAARPDDRARARRGARARAPPRAERLERVPGALGIPDDGSGDGPRAVRGIEAILADLEFPVMRDVGVTEEQIEDLMQRAMPDVFITQSPVPWTAAEVRAVFESALALESRNVDHELAGDSRCRAS